MFDLFGLRKEMDAKSEATPETAPAKETTCAGKRFWAALLLLDTALVLVFAGALAGMLWLDGPPARPPAPAHTARKAQPKLPAQARSEPALAPAPEPEKEPEAPPSKGPVGSPAVSAPELPKRQAESDATTQSPEKQQAPAPADRPRAKPVEFTCRAKDAGEVLLKGPFLVRTGGLKRMLRGSDEAWHTTVSLLPGEYKYHCVVDGKRRKAETVGVH